MFLEQLKCERLVAFRESAVADHVGEHDRRELAMFGAVLRHIAELDSPGEFRGDLTYEPTKREFVRQKFLRQRVRSSWLTASQERVDPSDFRLLNRRPGFASHSNELPR